MERSGLLERVGGINGHIRILDSAALHRISRGIADD